MVRRTPTSPSRQNQLNKVGRKWLPKTLFQKFFAGVAMFSGALLLASAYSVYVNPAHWPYVSLLGLAFPFFLGGTLLIAFLMLFFTPRQLWIPLVALLLCFPSIRNYFPVNLPTPPPKQSFKLLTWNVCAFWGNDLTRMVNGKEVSPTVDYILQQKPDIVCLQEAYGDDGFLNKFVYPRMKVYPYHKVWEYKGNATRIFSRYPIVKSQRLALMGNNVSTAYWLMLTPKDTLIVINNHLKSMGLTLEDRKEFKTGVEGFKNKFWNSTFMMLCRKISKATAKRAAMADSVADFIQAHKNQAMIVCGDFNDTPISYVRQTIGKGLTDAYRTTGNGLGRSFHQDAIVVRIDHVFCTPNLRPYHCHLGKDADTSDHYPMICSFTRK